MSKKKRPKWSTNVAKAMEKREIPCPLNCPGYYRGTEKDADGNVTRTFSCESHCPLKRKR
jgi:hypothetical protein